MPPPQSVERPPVAPSGSTEDEPGTSGLGNQDKQEDEERYGSHIHLFKSCGLFMVIYNLILILKEFNFFAGLIVGCKKCFFTLPSQKNLKQEGTSRKNSYLSDF